MRQLLPLLFLFFTSNAVSDQNDTLFMSAENLLTACTTADSDWISFCNGYLQAAHDLGAKQGLICAPIGTTRTDLSNVYDRAAIEIRKNPTMKREAGFQVALALFSTAYPCK